MESNKCKAEEPVSPRSIRHLSWVDFLALGFHLLIYSAGRYFR